MLLYDVYTIVCSFLLRVLQKVRAFGHKCTWAAGKEELQMVHEILQELRRALEVAVYFFLNVKKKNYMADVVL